MKNNSIINPFNQFVRLIHRYNLVLFIVLVAGGLIASVIILNNILTQPSSNNVGSSNNNSTTSDQSTINRLTNLETSTSNNSYQTLPSGRVNPFSE